MISRRTLLKTGSAALASGLVPFARAGTPELTIRYGSSAPDDQTYDPRVTMKGSEQQIIVQVFDRLIALGAEDELHPWLAKSWQIAADNRSITLQLRDDVKFHDGTALDSAAVKFTFDSIVDPQTGSMGALDVIGPYESSELLGAHEILLRYRRPFPRMAVALGDTKLSIVSPRAAALPGFGQKPVGTGPFRFVSWRQGAEVILERNPAYRWGPAFLPAGPPRAARIVHRFIPNASTRVAALDAGEIDVCEDAPALDARRMTSGRRYAGLYGNGLGVPFGFCLNSSRGPFADQRVRQAFMSCIDRRWIARSLFFGMVTPAWGPLAASAPEFWAGVKSYYPYDVAAADRLLVEAGWRMGAGGIRQRAGRRLSIYLPILLEPRIGVVLQANARKAGFDLKMEQVTHERQEELIFANAYDLLSLHWNLNDAGVLEVPFRSGNVPRPGHFSFNWSRYQDPALDHMLAAAAASSGAARLANYAQVQRLIMDEALFLPIHENAYNVIYSNRLTGLTLAYGNSQTLLAAAAAAG